MSESYRNWPEHKSAKVLVDEFAATRHGDTLRNASRYDLYRNKNTMSHEAWARLLGRDVNNLLHMSYTLDLAAHLERKRSVSNSPLARGRKLKAAGGHDNGEAITGDVLYIHKTDDHFEIEKQAFMEHLPEFYASPEDQVEMAEIAETIIFDDTSPEGREFNMVEQLGYLQTCLKAWAVVQYGKARDFREDDKTAILGITASVLGSTLDMTLRYYDEATNPEFNQYIIDRRKLMIDAFEHMPLEAFEIFGERKAERLTAFTRARQEWLARFTRHEQSVKEVA